MNRSQRRAAARNGDLQADPVIYLGPGECCPFCSETYDDLAASGWTR